MKKTKLFVGIGIGVLSLGMAIGGVLKTPEATPAYAGTSDVWSLCGTINGWNPANTDYDMTRTENDASGNYVWQIQVTFTAGAEWKIVKNHKWGGDIGWSDWSTDGGKGDYLQNSGGNFKVKTAGDYVVTFTDKSVTDSGYGPWAGDITIAPYTATKHTVTYHLDTVETEEYSDGEAWTGKFVEKEGYRLEGWCTDEELTTPFAKGSKVTSDLDLYPNYVAAEDYDIYVLDASTSLGSTSLYAYSWRDSLDGGNNSDWPGVAMTATEVASVSKFTVDASKSYDTIIFNGGNGKPQTINLDLAYESTLYVIGAKNSEEKYAASTVTVTAEGLAGYLMAEDTEGQCTTKYSVAKTVYLILEASEQESFKTDATYAAAYERYLAWATYHNDATPFEATSGTRGMLSAIINDQNNMIIVVVVIAASIIGLAVAVRFVRKARKQD